MSIFKKKYPDYRAADIDRVSKAAIKYIHSKQRADGSWYGSWAIVSLVAHLAPLVSLTQVRFLQCFTYATMFAIESLSLANETYENSASVRKACEFLLSKQMEDGGWGESYKVSLSSGLFERLEL